MKYSRRILESYTVGREEDGTISVAVREWCNDLELTREGLEALLEFSKTGEEPPLSSAEAIKKEKTAALLKTLNDLLKDDS